MKKIFKITGIVLLSLLLLLIIVPLAMKGKLNSVIETQANKYLNAHVSIDAVNVSLLRHFPNATVSLKDVEVVGKDDFAQDTLLSADKVSLTVNLMALLKNKGFDVVRVDVRGTDMKAIVLEDGRANWDILPAKENDEVVQAEEEGESNFTVKLRKLTLKDVNVTYDDRQGGMYAAVKDLGLTLSGDMTASHTTLALDMKIGRTDFRYGGVPYLSKAAIALKSDIDADLENKKFTLQDNTFSLNAITASIDGWLAMLDEGYDMDLTMKTGNTDFKEILSLIPAVYAKDFKDLKATGNVALEAWAKGKMVGDNLPAFAAKIKVQNGTFRYPSLPKGVDAIFVDASVANSGGTFDATVINVPELRFSMDNNPFSASMHLATPMSDPNFKLTAKGMLNLASVAEVYPLEDMSLQGRLNADLALDGRMSYIEKQQYDKISASGSLTVADIMIKLSDMPDVNVRQSTLSFSPRYVQLSETTVGIGRSDITADCKFENYVAFLLKGETIKGSLNVRSNLLDLNELAGNETTVDAQTPAEESEMKAPEVPKNIEFAMNVSIAKLLFSNLELDNTKGNVTIGGGKLDMRNLSFNTLGGSLVANGYYSTAAGIANPELNAAFNLSSVSFRQLFTKFVTVQKLAPVFEKLDGAMSGRLAVRTQLDSMMNPRFNTMNGDGSLSTRDVKMSEIGVISKIADAVGKPALKNMSVKDLKIDFTIVDGRVHTKPFDMKMGDVALNLSGSTGIDQTIDYTGKVTLPESTGIGKYTTLDLKIGGTFDSPTVGVDMKSMAEQAIDVVKTEALDKLGEKLGIDISDATKQREALIDQARKAGDKLIAEAKKQAENLVKEAGSNKIKVAVAQAAGKKLVTEAEKQAEALVRKATEEGDKLVEKASAGQ